LISASGVLSSANMPNIAGRDSFAGTVLHTGNWPRDGYDFAGKRVAVIGTGSSGIQVMPELAKQAAQVTVFQRTAAYTIPARNAPLDPAVQAAIKADYRGYRERWGRMPLAAEFEHRNVSALTDPPESARAEMEARWAKGGVSFGAAFNDLMMDSEANKVAAVFVREKIRATVKDPATAEALSPKQLFGCKRVCLDSDYYASFNQPHVSLVNLAGGGIDRIVPEGIVVAGKTYAFDVIVFATGFDAMTGSLLRMGIRGKGGQSLADKWAAGARTYLGVQTQGFPNLFMVTGPQSPSVFTNMVPAIEQDVDFIADCLGYLKVKGLHSIEAQADAEDAWVKHVGAVAESTLYTRCNSWYLGDRKSGV
jgi:cyclohexanone monooxygenase